MAPGPDPGYDTCLGDLFSVAWMEASEWQDLGAVSLQVGGGRRGGGVRGGGAEGGQEGRGQGGGRGAVVVVVVEHLLLPAAFCPSLQLSLLLGCVQGGLLGVMGGGWGWELGGRDNFGIGLAGRVKPSGTVVEVCCGCCGCGGLCLPLAMWLCLRVLLLFLLFLLVVVVVLVITGAV